MALAEKISRGLEKHVEKEKSKHEKKDKKKGGKHHFRVEQMDDGSFTIHHRVVPNGKPEYSEPTTEETSTHKSIKHVAKHMQACIGDEPESGVVADV